MIPTFGGRGGHPVLLSPAALDAIGRLDPRKDRLDAWLRTRKTVRVETEHACAVANWNAGVPA